MQHIVNTQGLNMPKLGLGTWPMLGDECTRAVEQALELGYRHIDTAAAYNNEDAVGHALEYTDTARADSRHHQGLVGSAATRRDAPLHGPQPHSLAQ
jgi:diketogulonate reductase-like aldo/keto reductase